MVLPPGGWYRFFYSPVNGPQACRLAGWVRVGLAVLMLADRLLLLADFAELFLCNHEGSNCILPYASTSLHPSLQHAVTIFQVWPESNALYWALYLQGLFSALLLLLGFFPRLQLVLLYLNMLQFHHHNSMIWDGEDVMFRLFTILMILCCIYAGAGLGKLANSVWRDGTAIYYISHEHAFFGGILTSPNTTLFDLWGVLKLATWSSLLLECTCFVTVWFAPKITVINMILLHVGIELTMNMHCFEWLSILGWCVFLAGIGESSDHDQKESPPTKKSSVWLRALINIFLLTIIAIFVIDTAPLDELYELLPAGTYSILEPAMEFRSTATERFIDPYLTPLGLYQGTWNMYSAAPRQKYQYEALIRFQNGTRTSWWSPDWSSKDIVPNWYVQKRWQRIMTFYENFEAEEASPVRDAFARKLAREYRGTVASIEWIAHIGTPPDPPPSYGLWDLVKRTYENTIFPMQIINLCDNLHDECDTWAATGSCETDTATMLDQCRASCGYCVAAQDLTVGWRISVSFVEEDEGVNFYDATVRAVLGNYLQLEYDLYDHKEEQFEWVNSVSLDRRGFVVLSDEEDVDEGEKHHQHTDENEGDDEIRSIVDETGAPGGPANEEL